MQLRTNREILEMGTHGISEGGPFPLTTPAYNY